MDDMQAFRDLETQLKERKIKKQEEQQAEDKKGRFNVALFNVLKTPAGRTVFKYIFDLIPVAECTFSSDPLVMAFNEGKRAVSVELRNTIKNELGIDALYSIEKQEI